MFAPKITLLRALACVLAVFLFIAVLSLKQSLRAAILFQETCRTAADVVQELLLPALHAGILVGLFATGTIVLLFFLIKAKLNAD